MSHKQQHLVSVGHLCQAFSMPYFVVIQTLRDRGVFPVMTMDLVLYYDFDESHKALEPGGMQGQGHE